MSGFVKSLSQLAMLEASTLVPFLGAEGHDVMLRWIAI